jgi:hypothetical protein
MEHQTRLFRLAPQHLYVTAHWTTLGWLMTITSSDGADDHADTVREVYGPLNARELIDVASSHLAALIEP